MSLLKYVAFAILPSFLKKFLLRIKGAKIGRNVKIGHLTYIKCKELEIGDNVVIGHHCNIRCDRLSLGNNIIIGSYVKIDAFEVRIGSDSAINDEVIIGGWISKESVFVMGKRCILMMRSFVNTARPVIFEDDVGVGGHCLLFTHAVWQSRFDGYPVRYGGITLRRGVWLPWGVFVMPGVEIGEGSTIGACSLVTKNIPPKSLAVGVPAKVVKTAPDYPENLDKCSKEAILSEILMAFSEHLRFNGIASDFEKKDDRIVVHSCGINVIYIRSGRVKSSNRGDVIIIFDSTDSDRNNVNVYWVNLSSKKACLGSSAR